MANQTANQESKPTTDTQPYLWDGVNVTLRVPNNELEQRAGKLNGKALMARESGEFTFIDFQLLPVQNAQKPGKVSVAEAVIPNALLQQTSTNSPDRRLRGAPSVTLSEMGGKRKGSDQMARVISDMKGKRLKLRILPEHMRDPCGKHAQTGIFPKQSYCTITVTPNGHDSHRTDIHKLRFHWNDNIVTVEAELIGQFFGNNPEKNWGTQGFVEAAREAVGKFNCGGRAEEASCTHAHFFLWKDGGVANPFCQPRHEVQQEDSNENEGSAEPAPRDRKLETRKRTREGGQTCFSPKFGNRHDKDCGNCSAKKNQHTLDKSNPDPGQRTRRLCPRRN